jgi:tetratricopeptide (TPR) repeat protein
MRSTRTFPIVLLAWCVAAVAATPEERYDEARHLMQRGSYREAAQAYRDVADSDAPLLLRAQALFAAGLMEENLRDYERALATYAEVGKRFPGTDFARRAADAARVLEQGGHEQGLAFKRRLDAAYDELFPAKEAAERGGLRAARPGLERAVVLLEGVLHDFADYPRAREVAMALGDAHMTLTRFGAAADAYARALALARGPGGDENAILSAQERLGEAIRAGRRQGITRLAWTVLGAIALGFVLVRPWSGLDASVLRLGATLAGTTLVLAAVAALAAYVVRQYVDDHSPVENGVASLLVALPGLTGQIVALGFASGLRGRGGRWRGALPAVLGTLAALAVAACVVNAYELFPFLDSEL